VVIFEPAIRGFASVREKTVAIKDSKVARVNAIKMESTPRHDCSKGGADRPTESKDAGAVIPEGRDIGVLSHAENNC